MLSLIVGSAPKSPTTATKRDAPVVLSVTVAGPLATDATPLAISAGEGVPPPIWFPKVCGKVTGLLLNEVELAGLVAPKLCGSVMGWPNVSGSVTGTPFLNDVPDAFKSVRTRPSGIVYSVSVPTVVTVTFRRAVMKLLLFAWLSSGYRTSMIAKPMLFAVTNPVELTLATFEFQLRPLPPPGPV
jgi:hypothetical protein